MALPPLTPEQRAAALEKAAEARTARARSRTGSSTRRPRSRPCCARARTTTVIGKMRVDALLESMPGVGKVRAGQIMERLGIAESRRVARPGHQPGRGARATSSAPRRATPVSSARPAAMTRLVVLSGPSGVGKSTVVAAAAAAAPRGLAVGLGHHPRAAAGGDRRRRTTTSSTGREFDELVAGGELLEWAEFAGNRYGTPRAPGGGAARGRASRCCWRSTCRAPGRCARRCRRRCWSSWPRRPGRSWCAGWSGAAPRTADDRRAPAGDRAGRAGRRSRSST